MDEQAHCEAAADCLPLHAFARVRALRPTASHRPVPGSPTPTAFTVEAQGEAKRNPGRAIPKGAAPQRGRRGVARACGWRRVTAAGSAPVGAGSIITGFPGVALRSTPGCHRARLWRGGGRSRQAWRANPAAQGKTVAAHGQAQRKPSQPRRRSIGAQSAILLALAVLLSGCALGLPFRSPRTDLKLRIQSPNPALYTVRVALDPPADYAVGADGSVAFTVPSFRSRADHVYLCGLKIKDATATRVPVIELRRGTRVARKLSLEQASRLPQDDTGRRIVKFSE